MKNPDEVIERVLAGLRDAEAPAGIEKRILEVVEARSETQMVATPRWAWRVAFASVIVVGLSLTITAILGHGKHSSQARQHPVPLAPYRLASPPANGQNASLLRDRPNAPISKPARIAAPVRRAREINAADAVLFAEMRAPSHPAAEAPLTTEERLLLRAVHLGDPQIIAMLNPEVRARQEAESEAEFQRFADQSAKGDSE
jgi:hypothetical protein